MSILCSGECERTKAAVHGAAFGLCLLMAGYNALAFAVRRERHLAINTAVYSFALVWEARLVVRHLTHEDGL